MGSNEQNLQQLFKSNVSETMKRIDDAIDAIRNAAENLVDNDHNGQLSSQAEVIENELQEVRVKVYDLASWTPYNTDKAAHRARQQWDEWDEMEYQRALEKYGPSAFERPSFRDRVLDFIPDIF